MVKLALVLVSLMGLPSAGFAEEKLNDPKIATIALTAHQIDVARGKFALSKTKNDEVKGFAQQMVDDHVLAENETLALAKKLGVRPEESAVTKSLKDGADKTMADLKKLKGKAFDKAYIDAEVAYHQAVIDAVKTVLLPNVQNAEVKKALESAGPLLEGHLVHAKQVQALFAK
jgi:putative membrane protein